ncbi:DDE_3 domain-containing protein [Trichonephila clavipes]|nr:DDE_3 domain-containing protein [Trichonephila clavipes]
MFNLRKQFQDIGYVERKPQQGHPRATTTREDHYFSIIARHNKDATASQLFFDPDFFIMDDNARPHRAYLVDEFLESDDICRMDWPVRSPGLIPVEQCSQSFYHCGPVNV